MRAAFSLVVGWLLPALALAQTPAASKPPVTVYRCTDAAGNVSMGDAPCPKGQVQQLREMLRPQDAPPRPATPAKPASVMQQTPAQQTSVQQTTVYLAPPRPMYTCTTPDGNHYTSDDSRGNPRWVPLWTLGYPVVRPKSVLGDNIGRPNAVLHPAPHEVNWPVATGGGTWVRDDCVMLPPADVCNVVRDRRDAIRTRFFNAQEKERDRLRIEERSINARLDNDCGGH